MSDYAIEHETEVPEEYEDELMYAGWTPELAQVRNGPVSDGDRHKACYGEIADIDVDAFLELMYQYQR
jgi:hypothetical protein